MKYGIFDQQGNPSAFYSEDVHGTKLISGEPNPACKIPAGAVPLTDADWAAFVGAPGAWRYIGGARVATPPIVKTIRDAKADQLAALAQKRYEVETSGITVGGILIKTDRESQAMLTGALARAGRKPSAVINWKGAGGWTRIGKVEIEAMADAVGDHVQACFDAERAHDEQIQTLTTIESVDAYDITTGWPVV